MTKKVPPGGQKMNYTKNRLREVDGRAMPIGKMVSLLILPFGNPKSARGGHPYLGKLFPFVKIKFNIIFDNKTTTFLLTLIVNFNYSYFGIFPSEVPKNLDPDKPQRVEWDKSEEED